MVIRLGILAALGCLVTGTAQSQTLVTDRTGVSIQLEGPVTLSGTTPLPLESLPVGEYRFKMEGPGLATVRGKLRHPGREFIPAKRPGLTSFVTPPGIAHIARDETWRGWLLLGGGVNAALQAVLAEASRRDADDEAAFAELMYLNAVSEDAIRSARLELESKRDRERDEAEMRNLWTGFLAAVWIGAAIENAVQTPTPSFSPSGQPGEYRLATPRISAGAAAFRSLLVPGSGQRYMGRDKAGNLFSTGVLGLITGTLLAQDSFLEARRDQRDAQRRYAMAETAEELTARRRGLDDATDKARDRNRLRWTLFLSTIGVHLWNVLDARAAGGAEASQNSLTWNLAPLGDGMMAGFSWSISE